MIHDNGKESLYMHACLPSSKAIAAEMNMTYKEGQRTQRYNHMATDEVAMIHEGTKRIEALVAKIDCHGRMVRST
jgi:hypothetical protein